MRFILIILSALGNGIITEAAGDELSYTRDIQPIFAEKCFNCHGPDKSEGGLQLHDPELALKEVDSGSFAVVPGNSRQSTLLTRVTASGESDRMPPEGKPLTQAQIGKLKQWIEAGAKYDRHWAYVPVKKPGLPRVEKSEWIRNEIDPFVLEKLEKLGVSPSTEAPSATLVKRLHYDLIGLPPDLKVVEKFSSSSDPDAYEELVDQLLASRHFGERWGRHWLDKARYADSDGYEKDRPRPNAWRYRDWVIQAINSDLPFDRFTIEQLAGDLLTDASAGQKLATGFHRQTLTNTEGGTDQEEFRVEATFDRTETVGSIWMGLTLTCARCHTHKYDQITQKEYFQIYSFFNNANEALAKVPVSELAIKKYETEKKRFDSQLVALENKLAVAIKSIRPEALKWLIKQKSLIGNPDPIRFHDWPAYRVSASAGVKVEREQDGVFVVTGKLPDKDKYTVNFDSPGMTITGVRLETLADSSLSGKGPGRAPNGNFVLSQVRAYKSSDPDFKKHERLGFSTAEADFAQNDFSAAGAVSDRQKSGWAIAPQMGKNHWANFYFQKPVSLSSTEKLQIVLDQQYGGQHLIGKFRIRLLTGFDPLKSLPQRIAEIIKSEKQTDEQLAKVAAYLAETNPRTKGLYDQIQELKKKTPRRPEMNVRVIVPASRKTQILHRGDFLQPGEEVASGVPGVVAATHSLGDGQATRLDFAKWIVDPRHPLTARVTVNHVWGHLFGRGIVSTSNDFGVRGELPSHPELLDWLAWEFSRSMEWSRKKLIKKIVMSATYRQSSSFRKELMLEDPENRLLARQNRFRVPGEIIRDLCLSVAGLLSDKIGGASVFPPLPSGVADLSYANNFRWKTSQGEDRYRRGMYTFFKRTSPHPNLITFDCPDSNTTKIQRDVSNTPIQALVTLNNEVFIESAQAMAGRILTEKRESPERIRFALQLCLVREPDGSEIRRFESLLGQFQNYYQNHLQEASKLVSRHAIEGVDLELNAAWVATARVILNLDEFMVRD